MEYILLLKALELIVRLEQYIITQDHLSKFIETVVLFRVDQIGDKVGLIPKEVRFISMDAALISALYLKFILQSLLVKHHKTKAIYCLCFFGVLAFAVYENGNCPLNSLHLFLFIHLHLGSRHTPIVLGTVDGSLELGPFGVGGLGGRGLVGVAQPIFIGIEVSLVVLDLASIFEQSRRAQLDFVGRKRGTLILIIQRFSYLQRGSTCQLIFPSGFHCLGRLMILTQLSFDLQSFHFFLLPVSRYYLIIFIWGQKLRLNILRHVLSPLTL